ncbi:MULTISPECIES: glycosyltransferase family A protein [unclassified Sinorhizobium]|uniref:glycosyltransferase family A protein n=1 Tax=unclassified Sinorhizobium TaxID=2613772 RepID=UPI003526AF7C
MRIITLSTIPPRFATLAPTLQSLLKQRASINEIRLYIPRRYRRFPDYDGSVPDVPDGVTIVRPEEDLGPASKVLFATRELRGRRAQILFCDDDKIFSPTWAADLLAAQATRPHECVALIGKAVPPDRGKPGPFQPKAVHPSRKDFGLRMRRLHYKISSRLGVDRPFPMPRPTIKAGYVDILQGLGGVVVRPDFFDDVAFNIPDVVWAVDDVWLSGMLARRNIPIWLPAGLDLPQTSEAHEIDALYRATIEGANRREANMRCVAYMQEHFGIWLEETWDLSAPVTAASNARAADPAMMLSSPA